MPFVVAAIVLLVVLCLLNKLITFAMLRRLRSYGERLASLPSGPPPGRPDGRDALVGA